MVVYLTQSRGTKSFNFVIGSHEEVFFFFYKMCNIFKQLFSKTLILLNNNHK